MNLHAVPSGPGRARAVVIVALVLVALVLGGCTGGDPEPEPSGSPSPSVTVSPTRSAAPERPAAMDRDDLEGVQAAAHHFLALYAYAYHTGDLAEWKAMSHPDCVFCSSVITRVEDLHGAGGYETGGLVVVEESHVVLPEEGKPFHGVDVRYSQSAFIKYADNGDVLEQGGPTRGWIYLALGWIDDAWVVREATVEGEE